MTLVCLAGDTVGLEDGNRKLDFMLAAFDGVDPFEKSEDLHEDNSAAVDWVLEHTPDEVYTVREQVMTTLESENCRMWASGECEKWLASCTHDAPEVVETVNGSMMEGLAVAASFDDKNPAGAFKTGAPLYGGLEACGMGEQVVFVEPVPIDRLKQDCARSNMYLLEQLVEAEHGDELFEITIADAKLGRMTHPVRVEELDVSELRLSPRFAVVQGEHADGRPKVRAVDNLSWAAAPSDSAKRMSKKRMREVSVNGHCGLREKITHDHLDSLLQIVQLFVLGCQSVPVLWKADIKSAFRRIPLQSSHTWAAGVAFKVRGQVWVSMHKACPFGALASVHAWERVGRLLATLARKLLHLPVLRYVDDLFTCDRPESAEHAKNCFARLCRVLLGPDAIEPKKLEHGVHLIVLGAELLISMAHCICKPAPKTIKKCMACIDDALELGTLKAGDAQKLAGRLNWSAQHLFNRLGRAMLRPIYQQKFTRTGNVGPELRNALQWWVMVLRLPIVEQRSWTQDESEPLHLYVDARSTPPRCAAVLFVDGKCLYTDGEPLEKYMSWLKKRGDNQIMTLEIMGIAVGMATFLAELRGRKVRIFCDNTAAEVCTYIVARAGLVLCIGALGVHV